MVSCSTEARKRIEESGAAEADEGCDEYLVVTLIKTEIHPLLMLDKNFENFQIEFYQSMDLPPLDDKSFLDVTPLNAEELQSLSISISKHENLLFGYFYALVQARERSQRLLTLSWHIIAINSANYTAWQTRRTCIETMDYSLADYSDELSMVDSWCARNPKNYQVWFHRRWLIDRIADESPSCDQLVESELRRLEESFEEEPKNYNAWSHRLYLSKKFNLLNTDQELEFTTRIIQRDVRNNSAWSYRRQVVATRDDLMQAEIDFTFDMIRLSPGNESAWIYLRSLPTWNSQLLQRMNFTQLLIETNQGTTPSPNMRHALETFIMSLTDKERETDSRQMIANLMKLDSIRQNSFNYKFLRPSRHR